MVAKSLKWALAGLVACPSAALALGLGDIHLRSTLNAPLDARIELVGATPDELASLKPQIASREIFTQHGLDWSPFLSNVTVRAVHTPDGHDVLELHSDKPVTEPFLTLLIELDWDRGRFVREYDLLLDPPVYTPNQGEVAHAVAAPVTGAATRQGTIERAAPESAVPSAQASEPSAAAPAPAAISPNTSSATSYRVRPGDTLSRIASQLATGSGVNERRWMVATYQVNPGAFDHNMNWLRSGAVLRIPSPSAIDAISPSEASAEVHRQYAAWRSESAHGASPAEQPGRLRLVAPTAAPGATAGAGTASASRSVKALQSEVQSLEAQLNESHRLLDVSNAKLAQLQAQLAARESGAAASAAAPGREAAEQQPAPAPQAATAASTAGPAEGAAPAPTPSKPHVAAHRPPRHRTVSSHPQPASPASSWLDSLKGLWWIVALAIAAALAYLGLRAWGSRRKAGFDDSLGRLAEAGAASHAGGREPSFPDAQLAPKRESSFVVEETGTHERPRLERAGAPAATTRHVEADDTISGDSAINLDQGDPLAEADFHMAYGLYDQAADLIRIAIQREPERRDLKLKLLEVFFVWGNKEQFLQTVHDLAATRAQAAPGEWEKIVIMGKQLAPEDPLFEDGAGVSGAAAGGVDLDLEGGQHRVDFDMLGEPAAGPQDGVDLDIGTAIGERDPVAEAAAQQATDKNLALDDSMVLPEDATAEREFVTATRLMTGAAGPGIGTTREMTGTTREMTTTLDNESWAAAEPVSEAPTVEQPTLHAGDHPTIREKVEMALKAGTHGEHTAELALDDLGLDLTALQDGPNGAFETSHASHDTVDDSRGAADGGAAADAPTLVAGLDERSRRIMETAEQRAAQNGGDLKVSETGTWHFDGDALQGAEAVASGQAAPAFGDLAETSRLTSLKAGSVDFEIGESLPVPKLTNGSGGVDLDIGTATVPDVAFGATQRIDADDLALPDLDPVTMSEVGTKLDLARAYMDMGDPEGARNILEEVLTEGSANQKQEAERLIASLPG